MLPNENTLHRVSILEWNGNHPNFSIITFRFDCKYTKTSLYQLDIDLPTARRSRYNIAIRSNSLTE
jgi:hypothetical protein